MPYHEFTIADITFRAVPFRNTPDNGDLTLQIYCACRHRATVNSNNDCRKLGAIIHDVNPEDNHAARPFRLEPPGEQSDFVELPARAISLRQGARKFCEAHQRSTAQYEADAQMREYRERQRSTRIAGVKAELDQLLKAVA